MSNSPINFGLDIVIIERPNNVQVVGLDHTHLFDSLGDAEQFILTDSLAGEQADAGGKCWFATHNQPADLWEHEFDPQLVAHLFGDQSQ